MKIKLFLLLAILYSNIYAQKSKSFSSDKYIIQFDASNSKLVKVEAQITLEDSLLYMSANGPVPKRWSKYVDNLVVFDSKGKKVNVEYRDSTNWIVKSIDKGNKIRLQYNVLIEHENENWPGGIDGVAFVRDWGVMASGRSLFVMNGDKTNIKVEFKKPKDWKVSTPWKKNDNEVETYNVTNLLQLQESLLFAGTHQEIDITRDTFNLKFVLGGDLIVKNKDEYVKRAGAILDYYIKIMGGVPRPEPGNDLSKVVVIINQSNQIDGEVIGNHISLFLNPKADMQGQVIGWFLFAHEFFHLWNGKTLRFNDTKADWFKEGISNYYTLKALNNAGFIGEQETKMVLNNLFYSRYINDSGYKKLAPVNAASGFDKDNHWGLVYGGGLFAGICMDMEIRHDSENSKSLTSLMRYFYEEFGGSEKTITNNDILKQVNRFANNDLTEFMNSYIKGIKTVPLSHFMKYAGIRVDTTSNQLRLTHMEKKTELQKMLWAGFLGKEVVKSEK